MSIWLLTFKVIPKNLLSFLIGWLTRWKAPRPIARFLNTSFAGFYKLNMDEAELPLTHYKSIEDVFTRALKPGARVFAGPFASPADGFLVRAAALREQDALQAKDWWYTASELVYGPVFRERVPPVSFSYYATVYLAPHNYHRVHTPFAGRVTAVRHITGRLWPVNERFVHLVPKLFIENERLCFDFDLGDGASASVVMVGALNVGRMCTPLVPNFFTNASHSKKGIVRNLEIAPNMNMKLGDELGTFMLGSTVIVVLNSKAEAMLRPIKVEKTEAVLVGQCLSVKREAVQ